MGNTRLNLCYTAKQENNNNMNNMEKWAIPIMNHCRRTTVVVHDVVVHDYHHKYDNQCTYSYIANKEILHLLCNNNQHIIYKCVSL